LISWSVRESLSQANKLRRSYYELLRESLDEHLLQSALIDSYENFSTALVPYPFVERRELKPRARIPTIEYEHQRSFLVIFIEDSLPSGFKKYIRYFDVNKTTKTNLLAVKDLPLFDEFDRNQKYLESAVFFDFMKILLPVDYALLIQRDPATKLRNRYALSHFHVRVDWPIADATEDLARFLRYISKDVYEKGDKYAEDLQKKLFEYYGLPVMSGGRRTAAIVAAQYLRRLPCISTVYVGSSESRSLVRIGERGVVKSILVKLSRKEIRQIADSKGLKIGEFMDNYVIASEGKDGICIFQTYYTYSTHGKPPVDGKLRELNSDLYWINVGAQQILPKFKSKLYPPVHVNLIYA